MPEHCNECNQARFTLNDGSTLEYLACRSVATSLMSRAGTTPWPLRMTTSPYSTITNSPGRERAGI